jgi:hypothetical protein
MQRRRDAEAMRNIQPCVNPVVVMRGGPITRDQFHVGACAQHIAEKALRLGAASYLSIAI